MMVFCTSKRLSFRHGSKRDINQRSVELTRQVTGIVRIDGTKEADAFAIGQVIRICFSVVHAKGHTERYKVTFVVVGLSTMSAPSPTAHLLDLPDELLLLILKQLDDIDILSSFFNIGNHRLHRLTCHKTSPTHLHFPLNLLSDSLFERLTQQIFPRIHHHVESLTLPTELLERVLLRDQFPNLTELTLCNFQRDTALHHFTGKTGVLLETREENVYSRRIIACRDSQETDSKVFFAQRRSAVRERSMGRLYQASLCASLHLLRPPRTIPRPSTTISRIPALDNLPFFSRDIRFLSPHIPVDLCGNVERLSVSARWSSRTPQNIQC